MKFKEYLKDPKDLNEYINNNSMEKEWSLILKGWIPLRPSLLDSMEIDKVYHVTDIANYDNLIKYQNQKKQISTFTKGKEWLASGARTRGGVLVELRGKTVFVSPSDLFSALSRNGYRWIQPSLGMKRSRAFATKVQEKVYQYLRDQTNSNKIPKKVMVGLLSTAGINPLYNLVDELPKNEKRDFIKFYFDLIKKEMNKQVKDDIFKDLLELQDGNISNEVLLHDYKIIKTWSIDQEYEDENNLIHNYIEKNGINYQGMIKRTVLNDIKKLK